MRAAGWRRMSLRLREDEFAALARVAEDRREPPGRVIAGLILEAGAKLGKRIK